MYQCPQSHSALVTAASQRDGRRTPRGKSPRSRETGGDGMTQHIHLGTHRGAYDSGDQETIGQPIDVKTARVTQESAQAQLAHAGRLAMLGEMSASIVHEVSQPLAAIVANGAAGKRWLEKATPDVERALATLKGIIEAADRATRMIHHIRALATDTRPEMSSLDLNGVVDEALALVQRDAFAHIPLQPEMASGLPPVRGNRTQLQQVIINLVVNGLQATAAARDRTSPVIIRTGRCDADRLLLVVEDAGVGVEPEKLDRVFSPFYTTKPDGMGMGLSICQSIVDAHGGELRATRNPGRGMTFGFTVPLARERRGHTVVGAPSL